MLTKFVPPVYTNRARTHLLEQVASASSGCSAQGICAGCRVLGESTLSLLLICSANLSRASARSNTSAKILQSHSPLTWNGEGCRHLLLMEVPCDLRVSMTAYKLWGGAEIGDLPYAMHLGFGWSILTGSPINDICNGDFAPLTPCCLSLHAQAAGEFPAISLLGLQHAAEGYCCVHQYCGGPTLARCRSASHSNADRTLTPL